MVSTLVQWLIVGVSVGSVVKLARRWHGGWGTALLSGIGAAFILFTALTIIATYTL